MDIYILLTHGADPTLLPQLMHEDFEVLGPDQVGGWTICGAESVVLAAITSLVAFQMVRSYVVL